MNMINAGITFFEERPLFGHGIDSFRQLYFNYVGDYRYSHNNYVELLVSVGVFGTVIYYFGLLSVLKKSFNKTNPYLIFPFVVIATILIIDYGLVSYTSYLIQYFICLAFVSIGLNNRQKIIINKNI